MNEFGHATVEGLLPPATTAKLRTRISHVLDRRYETGIYPDESYYRPGATLPGVPRHVVNAWKCDRRVAAVAASEQLAEIAASVFGWSSLRLAVDTVWAKPPGSMSVDYHQEFEYFHSLIEAEVASCWIALDDMSPDNGSLEFASGSHRWQLLPKDRLGRILAASSGRAALETIASAVQERPRITMVACPAGAGTFFHGRVWHGSQANRSAGERWAYGIHWIKGDAKLTNAPTYLFGRYKLAGSNALHDSFFPMVWSRSGERSPWIDAYIAGGPLGG